MVITDSSFPLPPIFLAHWGVPSAKYFNIKVSVPPEFMRVFGVTAVDAKEEDELPTAFVATTVKLYAVPFVKPVTVAVVVEEVAVNPPG